MRKFELIPVNGRKSFNRKAYVIEENDISELHSYDTPVAQYNNRTKEIKVFGTYSDTTVTHINAFLSFYGFATCTKKELIKTYSS